MTPQKRVLVVGGGMVGGTAAALLARAGHAVTLIDAAPKPSWDASKPVGLRVSAISPGSAKILDAAGAWSAIVADRHCPYRRMRVEDGQGSGVVEFEAGPFGMERLGTIVENPLVVHALAEALEALPTVQVHYETTLNALEQGPDAVRCQLSDGRELEAELLLACDGVNSSIRRQLKIDGDRWDYNQHGIVGLVRKRQPNPGVAWQRFLPGGPLALLPLADGWSSMVWTLPSAEAKTMLALDDDAFCERLGGASDGWLGGVESIGPRAAFPLAMSLGTRYQLGRVALLGDAAHAVHPLAGQGVNLGLADAAALAECLDDDEALPAALQRWERWRRSEAALMAGGVHALGALFRPGLLSLPRALGMRLVGRSWTLREAFLQRAAGQGPNAPLLATQRAQRQTKYDRSTQ